VVKQQQQKWQQQQQQLAQGARSRRWQPLQPSAGGSPHQPLAHWQELQRW
jgi:hypothetical protein